MNSVTIGVTTYKNRIKFLNQSILSILNQTYQNYKIIISNDSPEFPISKNSFNFEIDERITIINNKKNLGEEKNMNQLLRLAQTPWFTWLADDDVLHPDFLASKMNFLEKNFKNNIVAVYSNFAKKKIINEEEFINKDNYNFDIYELERFHSLYLQRKINCIGCYGLLKTEYLKKINGIKKLGDSYGPFSDTMIPLILSKHGSIAWSPETLSIFREHQDSLSQKADFNAFYSAKIDFIKIYLKNFENIIENKKFEKNIFFFNRWFMYSIFQLLKRDKSKNLFNQLKFIFNFKKNIFYKNLSNFHSCLIICYILKLFLNLISNKFRTKFHIRNT